MICSSPKVRLAQIFSNNAVGKIKQKLIEDEETRADCTISRVFDRGGNGMNSLNGSISTTKRHHSDLRFEGICSECAHCGHALTDSVSIERGIGPVCSKKGYLEDPKDADELQAMIDLAEYPDLVEFLVEHHKPQGVRGLMNGLVKLCSLNRKHEAFGAMCEAISSLGFDKLASVLRESIAVVEVKIHKEHPDYYLVWVKKRDFTWAWNRALKAIPGWRYPRRGLRGILIPKREEPRRALWRAMKNHYEGLCVKTPNGCFKIETRPKAAKVVA